MTHNLIKTGQYLLIVDDSKIKEGLYVYDEIRNTISKCLGFNKDATYLSDAQHWKKDCKRIIAHFPLNGAPVLDGVDLLPEIEHECRYCGVMTTQPDCECYKVPAEDDVIKLADDLGFYDSTEDNKGNYATKAFVAGYNKARDRFKYTEEDMMRAIAFGVSVRDQGLHLDQFIYDKFIQKKKLPVAFEAELNPWSILEEPITQVNSKGVHVWVGNYIY